jgi:TonB-linked SusC/RagA family outer membrane protein
MRKTFSFLAALLLCSMLTIAQQKTITGRVVDPQGQPVSFATVKIKGAKGGVSADADGNFSIKVSPSQTLIITGTGIAAKEVPVGQDAVLNIQVARSNSNLDEVVVTALGVKRSRNSLPYAAQQISGDEVNKTVTTNFVDNLSGKVAGLQITASNTMGGSTNAILRGMKSLTQSNQALFVVDGVPYDNSNQSTPNFDLGNTASDINPDDIESVSVLKGAAASALYGSRASNGVILITTKKGLKHKGVGVGLTFGASVGSLDPSTLPKYQTQYGEGYGSIGNDPGGPNLPGFFYYQAVPGSGGQPVKIVQTNVDAATGPAYDPSIQVYNWQSFAPGDPLFGKSSAWQPAAHHNPTDFFVTPVTSTVNLSVDGGSDHGTFHMGITHDDGKDFMPNSADHKNLINLNATHNITDRLSIGGTLNYSDNTATGRYKYPYTGTTNVMTDFRQWWPTDVNLKALKNDYFSTLTNDTWNWQANAYNSNVAGSIGLPAYHDNPYWDRYTNYEQDERYRYFGNVNANYKITDYLSLMARVAEDYYTQQVETRTNIGSQSVSYYDRYNQTYSETNYDFLLNFNKNLGDNFNLKALLGGNIRQDNVQSLESATNGGLIVPNFYAVANSLNAPNAPTEITDRKEVDGLFAGATISYKEMLTLDGTIRRDQSSTLPDHHNSYYYPSVSGNFAFSKLLPNLTWLSYGKIWANYAQVGGDAPYYSLINTYNINPPFNGQPIISGAATNNNPTLLPETNKTYELGLEAAFLNNRLGFSADYYHSQQINEITPAGISEASGYEAFFVNAGTVQNSGVELTVNLVPVKTRNFSWTMAINWSKNINKVLSLYDNQPAYVISPMQNSVQIVAEAKDANSVTPKNGYGVIRGTDYVYSNGQRVIDASGRYEIAGNSLTDIGNFNPDWYGGVNNSFSYKNWALSFLIDVRQGGSLYSLDMDYGSSSGLYPRTAGKNDLGNPVRSPLSQGGGIILKGVQLDATGKATPNTTRIDESDIGQGNFTFSSAYGEADKQFVYDASYVKLRELAITYSLGKGTLEKIGFLKGVTFSLSGRNLWIIHKNEPYADPEQGQALGSGNSGQNGGMGFQNGAYPTARTVAGTVKFNF